MAIVSSSLVFSGVNNLIVRTDRSVVKTVLVESSSYSVKGTRFIFRYNDQKFMHKFGRDFTASSNIGDTVAFYHLPDKPQVFVYAQTPLGMLYFELCIAILLMLLGIITIAFSRKYQKRIF